MNLTSFAIYSIVLMLFHNRNNSEARWAWVALGKLLGKGIYHSARVGSLSRTSAQGRLEMINRNKRRANGPRSLVGKSCQTIAADVLVCLFVSSLSHPRRPSRFVFARQLRFDSLNWVALRMHISSEWICDFDLIERARESLPGARSLIFLKPF